jgi:hypothetical protein
MNWEAIGAIGDFVSGAAVVMTLAYLLVQNRQTRAQLELNMEAVRIAAGDSFDEPGRRVRELFIANPDAAELYYRGLRDLAAVDEEERPRFDLLMIHQFYAMQTNYTRFALHGPGDSKLACMNSVLDRLLKGRGTQEWWLRRKRDFDPEFRTFVDRRIEEHHAPSAQPVDSGL